MENAEREIDDETLVNGPDDRTATGTPSDGASANEGLPVSAAGSLTQSTPIDPKTIPPGDKPADQVDEPHRADLDIVEREEDRRDEGR